MLSKAGLVAVMAISGVVGAAFAISPRDVYNQMYPPEALKRDVFHICRDTNPTFVRALETDRDQCFDSMPHAIALAIGWVQPQAALWAEALRDPSRHAELLLALASLPPRPSDANVPRSFDNATWMRALSSGCGPGGPASAPKGAAAVAPLAGSTATLALSNPPIDRLVPVPQAARGGVAGDQPLPLIPLTESKTMTLSAPPIPGTGGKAIAAYDALAAPDLGDNAVPAIVPLAPSAGCRNGV